MQERMRRHLTWALTLALGVLSSCSKPEQAWSVPEGCNPLAPEYDCLLPFPSDYFLAEDVALPLGHRVRLSEAAKPKTKDGTAFDFTELHPADGWSHGTQILALF